LRSSETAAFTECLLNTEGAGLCPSLLLNEPKFSARYDRRETGIIRVQRLTYRVLLGSIGDKIVIG